MNLTSHQNPKSLAIRAPKSLVIWAQITSDWGPESRAIGPQITSDWGPKSRAIGGQITSDWGPKSRAIGAQITSDWGPNHKRLGPQWTDKTNEPLRTDETCTRTERKTKRNGTYSGKNHDVTNRHSEKEEHTNTDRNNNLMSHETFLKHR